MKIYWVITLFLMMGAVGMSLDPRDVISRWTHLPRGYWVRVIAATFFLPPLIAMLLVALVPMAPEVRGGVLIMSIAPGAPMLTRMVSKQGVAFDPGLAASYQIVVGLLVPLLTPPLLYGLGRFYHRDVWVDPWTLAWQVASMQFIPLALGLIVKHYFPAFALRAEPWLSRIGNLMVIAYLLIIVFGLRKVMLAVGPVAAGTGACFAIGCLASGHFLGGPTIAMSNTNRHVGLAILIAGLNFPAVMKLFVPFFASYALLAPLFMIVYGIWQRRRILAAAEAAH